MKKILMTLGGCIAATALATAQGTWTPIAPMLTARENFATAKGADGRIYAIGGDLFQGTFTPTNIMEVYDPVTNSWTGAPSMPTARYSVTAATANGIIYVFGGYNGFPRNSVEAFDPSTNTWSIKAAMPTARHALSAVTAGNGKIYVIGGDTSGGGGNTNIVEIYDPLANSWSNGPAMPTTRGGSGATLAPDGRIYVIGGNVGGVGVNTAIALDTATNVWSPVASMTVSRSALRAATGADGKIYASGGQIGAPQPSTDAVEAYDLGTGTWTTVAPLPVSRVSHGSETGNDGRIYVFGGWRVENNLLTVRNDGYAYIRRPLLSRTPSAFSTIRRKRNRAGRRFQSNSNSATATGETFHPHR